MNKRKKIIALFLIAFISFTICSCSKKEVMKQTFETDQGKEVEVILDISDGHSITDSVPFDVIKNDKELSKFTFIPAETMKDIKKMLTTDDKAKVLEEGKKNGNEFIFWQYEFKPDHYEYDYIIILDDSGLAAFASNVVSEESAMDCIEKLEFKIK